MATDPFPLLQRLKVGSYENCAIVTYNADLFFFEQVVLPTLRSHGCNNNLILMDLKQYEASLLSAAHDLRSLGKSYSVWPVSATGAFHPKLIFQSGRRGGRLILGSGNLDLPATAAALAETGFKGLSIIEYEGAPDNPVPPIKECVAAVRGQLSDFFD